MDQINLFFKYFGITKAYFENLGTKSAYSVKPKNQKDNFSIDLFVKVWKFS